MWFLPFFLATGIQWSGIAVTAGTLATKLLPSIKSWYSVFVTDHPESQAGKILHYLCTDPTLHLFLSWQFAKPIILTLIGSLCTTGNWGPLSFNMIAGDVCGMIWMIKYLPPFLFFLHVFEHVNQQYQCVAKFAAHMSKNFSNTKVSRHQNAQPVFKPQRLETPERLIDPRAVQRANQQQITTLRSATKKANEAGTLSLGIICHFLHNFFVY